MRSFALVLFSSTLVAANLFGRDQSIAVRGQLICNNAPAGDVTIKLYDVDGGLSITTDDLMASGKTDRNGNFLLSGWNNEFTTIDPKINIYHDCNDGIKPCQRKFSIILPKDYVSKGKIPQKTYDAGTIQLAGKFPGESRDCLH